MSKFYIPLLAAALVGSSATAQQNVRTRTASQKARPETMRPAPRPAQQGAAREIIWSDDLSNASHWVAGTVIPDGQATIDADTWEIGTNPPSGAFAIDTILSTTADNGFALFDSDLACGGHQNATLTMANPVDLSAYSGVLFQFEQYTARWRGDYFIDVSTDGGTVWTEFEVNVDLDVASTVSPNTLPNPDTEVVNISSAAAGQMNVLVRFRYFSTQEEHADDAGCDYAWMVDDVAFTTVPDNEIVLNYGYTSITGSGEEYGRVPADQFGSTLNIGGEAFNFGGQDQTNVSVDVTFSGAQDLSTSIPVGTLATQATFIADMDYTMSPNVGNYTVTFDVNSDQLALDGNLDDNQRVRTFEITNGIFSLDNIGQHPADTEELEQNGTGSFADNTENVKLMTMYPIRADYEITGLQIELGPASTAGGQIVISILDTTDVLADPSVTTQPVSGLESAPYTLTAADIAAGVVTIPFLDDSSPVTLTPGAYYACAAMTQVGDGEVYILDDATVPQPGLASVLWLPFDPDGQFLYGGNGTAYAIRLTNELSIGVREEATLEGVTMYPNPTNGVLRINTVENGKMTVEVMNVLGELLTTTSFSGNTVLDLGGFADGVYSVRVSNGSKTTVQRITLN